MRPPGTAGGCEGRVVSTTWITTAGYCRQRSILSGVGRFHVNMYLEGQELRRRVLSGLSVGDRYIEDIDECKRLITVVDSGSQAESRRNADYFVRNWTGQQQRCSQLMRVFRTTSAQGCRGQAAGGAPVAVGWLNAWLCGSCSWVGPVSTSGNFLTFATKHQPAYERSTLSPENIPSILPHKQHQQPPPHQLSIHTYIGPAPRFRVPIASASPQASHNGETNEAVQEAHAGL